MLCVGDCPLKTEEAGECGIAMRKDHKIVISLTQLNLVVLLLRFLACHHAAQPEYATHTTRKNSRKGYALAQIPIPEHVHLELLLHYLSPLARQLYLCEPCHRQLCLGGWLSNESRSRDGGTWKERELVLL